MLQEKNLKNTMINGSLAVFLALLSAVMLYPMLHVIFTSLSEPAQLIRHRGLLFRPLGFDTIAYDVVLRNPRILSGYGNTLFILFFGLIFNIVLTSLGAYFLSRKGVFWSKTISLLILLTMYFSGGLVPFYLTVRNLGLYNSLWALILPTAVNTYNMIILRTYFQTIPDSLVESVHIDGGGHFTILFRIFLPLSLPAMAVMVLYYGVGHWNTYFNAMIYIKDRQKWTLQLVLRDMLIQGSNLDVDNQDAEYQQVVESIKAAMVIVSTVPILCIYPFLQKYFVGGIMIGSLKG